jgi:hypothetical protein
MLRAGVGEISGSGERSMIINCFNASVSDQQFCILIHELSPTFGSVFELEDCNREINTI